MKRIPNIISLSRGLAALGLLWTSTFGTAFWIIYLWCGISDMIDGPLARRLGAESRRGAVIDSVADLTFVIAAFIKVLPELTVTTWQWIWIAAIAAIRIGNMIIGHVKQNRFVSLHTTANKLTGLLLFLLPAAILFLDQKVVISVVCAVATFASVQECIISYSGSFRRSGLQGDSHP